MGVLIPAMTKSAESDLFRIEPGRTRGFFAKGIAGAEECVIETLLSDGTYGRVGALTVAAPFFSLSTVGWFRITKPVTVGAAFVDSL